MKLRLLLIATVAFACGASAAIACEAHKAAAKSANTKSAHATAAHAKHANHAACTAEMAAQCTPAMRAACESNAAVAKAMGCEMSKGVTTMNVVASAKPTSAKSAAKGGDCCAMKGSRGTTTTAVAAVATPGKGMDAEHCAADKASSYASHAVAMASQCASCESWVSCESDVRALGAKAQVVPLKNGVMVVYTADSPGDVRVLQSAVAKRHDRMLAALAAGQQKLCDECKQLRGAMASGKLNREVVNVERGCMTLMTSNDRGVVQKIRAMNGQAVATR
jgi:hypothetical protein